MKELQSIVAALRDGAAPAALATLVSVQGSSYRRPGARLLVTRDGRRIGSISGGCLEEDLLLRAQRVLASGKPEAVVYDTTAENDLVWGVGLGCHGVVRIVIERLEARPTWSDTLADNFAGRRTTALEIVHDEAAGAPLGTRLAAAESASGAMAGRRDGIYFENVPPPTALVVFGAGDDARPLVRFAKELGWNVTVADPRAAFATADRFPEADALIVASADQLVARSAPRADTLAIVMTHHYVHDVPLLRDLLRRPLAYLGLLGPRKRAEKMLADLAAEGVAPTGEQRARLFAPVGLDLGADGPEQVGLSILAEMQAQLRGRDARPLRERTQPIHG